MSHFGSHITTFATNRVTYWILIGVAAICSFFAALTIWIAIGQYYAPPSALDEMSFGQTARRDGLITGGIIGGLNLFIAVGCIAAARYQNSVRAELFEHGLVSYRGKRVHQIAWRDVERVVEHRFESLTHTPSHRRRSVRFYVTVHGDDREILLRGIENVRRAGELIADRCGLSLQRVNE